MILIINVDVVRARSSKFEEYTGMPLVNIPAKGMGASEHAIECLHVHFSPISYVVSKPQ